MSIIKITNILIIIIFLLFSSDLADARGRYSWQYYFQKGKVQFKAEMYNYSILNLLNALDLNPKLYEAANYLSDIYFINNKRYQALEYLIKSLEIYDRQADTHCKKGKLHQFYADENLAFKHFKKSVAIDPNHLLGNLYLVRYYYLKKNKTQAQFHFNKANTLSTKRIGKYLKEAEKAERENKTEIAINLYKRCIKDGPATLKSYYRLFEIYRSNKNYKDAAHYLEKVKIFKPDEERPYLSLGHLYFTKPFSGKKILYLKKSIKNFKGVIKLNPQNKEAHHMLSYIYRYMGKDIEAMKFEKKLRDLEK